MELRLENGLSNEEMFLSFLVSQAEILFQVFGFKVNFSSRVVHTSCFLL